MTTKMTGRFWQQDFETVSGLQLRQRRAAAPPNLNGSVSGFIVLVVLLVTVILVSAAAIVYLLLEQKGSHHRDGGIEDGNREVEQFGCVPGRRPLRLGLRGRGRARHRPTTSMEIEMAEIVRQREEGRVGCGERSWASRLGALLHPGRRSGSERERVADFAGDATSWAIQIRDGGAGGNYPSRSRSPSNEGSSMLHRERVIERETARDSGLGAMTTPDLGPAPGFESIPRRGSPSQWSAKFEFIRGKRRGGGTPAQSTRSSALVRSGEETEFSPPASPVDSGSGPGSPLPLRALSPASVTFMASATPGSPPSRSMSISDPIPMPMPMPMRATDRRLSQQSEQRSSSIHDEIRQFSTPSGVMQTLPGGTKFLESL